MLPYRLSTQASHDLDGVRQWYDRLDVVLGDRVVEELFETVDLIRDRPQSFPEIEAGIRAARCRKFPYRVYFAVTSEGVNVLAIYHTSRDPARWDEPDRE